MTAVRLHYWAGARAAAGTEFETVDAPSVAAALAAARRARDDPGFDRVIRACAFLVDGVGVRADDLENTLSEAVTVDVLPPFAGGSASKCVVSTHERAETSS